MLTGYHPFDGETREEMIEKIKNGDFHFRHSEWNAISYEAKDLIGHLLVVDPEQRLKIKDALHHPWFASLRPGSLRTIPLYTISRIK